LNKKWRRFSRKAIQGLFSSDLIVREDEIREDLVRRELQEETLWRQKSRIHWLREGDKNTRFFHNSLTQRRNMNRIVSIQA
jgi:hypothetical protein